MDMTKNVPIEILTDVLAFLPCLDLDNDELVCKKWQQIINGGRTKKFPQRQEVTMRTIDQPNEPFAVELSIADKTVKCTEGKDNPKDVLEHCIVNYEEEVQGVDAFQERFRRIQALVGAQPIPLKLLNYRLDANERDAELEELIRFREIYSSKFFYLYLIILKIHTVGLEAFQWHRRHTFLGREDGG